MLLARKIGIIATVCAVPKSAFVYVTPLIIEHKRGNAFKDQFRGNMNM